MRRLLASAVLAIATAAVPAQHAELPAAPPAEEATTRVTSHAMDEALPGVAGPAEMADVPCIPVAAVMTPRAIAPSDPLPATTALDLATTGTVSLFVPETYKVADDGAIELTVHFHGATWFAIQEHQRRGLDEPLVALELGQGSSAYAKPFEDGTRFPRLLEAVAAEMKKRGAPENARVTSVNLTSFSAGYGAVREILKRPDQTAMVQRIVLGDSSYASLDEEALKAGRRIVVPEHVEPWANFARMAMKGEKTLLMTTSEITPETYAGTHEVAAATVAALGLQVQDVAAGSCDAAMAGLEYPLHHRADAGSFHWWGYGGRDTVVHMTVARHIADGWMALDECGEK